MNRKKLKNPIKKHNGELNAFLNLIEKDLEKILIQLNLSQTKSLMR
jgi:hypothetical protein